jgi:hypothetical protein
MTRAKNPPRAEIIPRPAGPRNALLPNSSRNRAAAAGSWGYGCRLSLQHEPPTTFTSSFPADVAAALPALARAACLHLPRPPLQSTALLPSPVECWRGRPVSFHAGQRGRFSVWSLRSAHAGAPAVGVAALPAAAGGPPRPRITLINPERCPLDTAIAPETTAAGPSTTGTATNESMPVSKLIRAMSELRGGTSTYSAFFSAGAAAHADGGRAAAGRPGHRDRAAEGDAVAGPTPVRPGDLVPGRRRLLE